MPDKKLTNEEQMALWRLARQRLELIKSPSAISSELVDRLRSQLPARLKDETLGDLIRRSSDNNRPSAEIKPFKTKLAKHYTPLTEFIRLAADSHDDKTPLPLPENILESADGQFRLKVTVVNDRIEIFMQALGFAADQFANCCIGLANPGNENGLIAKITLDQDGDGICQIKDTPLLRRALLKPVFVLLE